MNEERWVEWRKRQVDISRKVQFTAGRCNFWQFPDFHNFWFQVAITFDWPYKTFWNFSTIITHISAFKRRNKFWKSSMRCRENVISLKFVAIAPTKKEWWITMSRHNGQVRRGSRLKARTKYYIRWKIHISGYYIRREINKTKIMNEILVLCLFSWHAYASSFHARWIQSKIIYNSNIMWIYLEIDQ